MHELYYLILGQFLVSALMGLGALCLFVWAAAAGLLPRRRAREVPGARLRGDRP